MNPPWGLLLAITLAPRPPGTEAIRCYCEGLSCVTLTGAQQEECPDAVPDQYKAVLGQMFSQALDKVKEGYKNFVTATNLTGVPAGGSANETGVPILDKITPGSLSAVWDYFNKLHGQGRPGEDVGAGDRVEPPVNNQFCVKVKVGEQIVRSCGALVSTKGMRGEDGCEMQGTDVGYCRCSSDLCNDGDVEPEISSAILIRGSVYIVNFLLLLRLALA